MPRLVTALSAAARNITPFELELSGAGCFGNRVLWIGIGAGVSALNQLAQTVRELTAGIGEHQEKREFNAHVTLGRFREPAKRVSASLRKNEPPPFGQFRVEQVELIRSELSPKGSRYTTLESFVLGGKVG